MNSSELDDIVSRAMERLNSKSESEAPQLIDDWYLTEVKHDSFENALQIIGTLVKPGETIPWKSGVISDANFHSGVATEMSGQRYILGKVNRDYLKELWEKAPDFAAIVEKLDSDR